MSHSRKVNILRLWRGKNVYPSLLIEMLKNNCGKYYSIHLEILKRPKKWNYNVEISFKTRYCFLPPPHNFILFQLDFDVKFPLLRLLLFLIDYFKRGEMFLYQHFLLIYIKSIFFSLHYLHILLYYNNGIFNLQRIYLVLISLLFYLSKYKVNFETPNFVRNWI